MKIRLPGTKALSFLKKYGSRIAYYGCVAVVLTAIAAAAENYRSGEESELVLPEADLPVLMQESGLHYLFPEGMEVLRSFSSLPEWNDDLLQWEAHTAVDYRFQDDVVSCLADGTVLTIGRSGLYGGFVEMDCGDAVMRYASIIPSQEIEVGERLEAGEEIGKAACSMPGEEALGKHVHLEILLEGKLVDYEALRSKNEP